VKRSPRGDKSRLRTAGATALGIPDPVSQRNGVRIARLKATEGTKVSPSAPIAILENSRYFTGDAALSFWRTTMPARPVHRRRPEEAAGHFGLLAVWIAGNGPAASARTRARLGWMPEQPGLIRDISQPEYFN